VLAERREVVLVALAEERVAVTGEQGLVRVHPAAVHALHRLGHERGVDAELLRDLLHGQAIRHHVVGHRQCVRVAQVDLVLARSHLVMDVFDRNPHGFEVRDRALAPVRREVERGLVEVAALVEELRLVHALEVEVLELRPDVEGIAEIGRALQLPLQDEARVALERRAVGVQHVAEHPGDLRLGLPRDQLERGRVGDGDHVRLLDPAEPVDRRAVEPHPLGERALELL
jgi:hypothetical protein